MVRLYVINEATKSHIALPLRYFKIRLDLLFSVEFFVFVRPTEYVSVLIFGQVSNEMLHN